MANYRVRVPISRPLRTTLILIGIIGLAIAVVFALAKAWFLALASAGVGLFCLFRAARGHHSLYRDDGEP
jgi:hypothetical protein